MPDNASMIWKCRTIGETLNLLVERNGLSDNELARQTGASQPTISRIRSGSRSHPRGPTIAPIAKHFGISLSQLRGEVPLPWETNNAQGDLISKPVPDNIRINYYDAIQDTATQGCPPASQADVTTMYIARGALWSYGVKAADAALLQAHGDSMAPQIDDQSLLLIDQSETDAREGLVYAVRVAEEVLIRRVQWLPDGLRLIADNPAYEAMDADTATVIGRVVVAWHTNRMIG